MESALITSVQLCLTRQENLSQRSVYAQFDCSQARGRSCLQILPTHLLLRTRPRRAHLVVVALHLYNSSSHGLSKHCTGCRQAACRPRPPFFRLALWDKLKKDPRSVAIRNWCFPYHHISYYRCPTRSSATSVLCRQYSKPPIGTALLLFIQPSSHPKASS